MNAAGQPFGAYRVVITEPLDEHCPAPGFVNIGGCTVHNPHGTTLYLRRETYDALRVVAGAQ